MTASIPSHDEPSLSLRDVEVRYGARVVLSGITLRPFAAGEVVALVGPNGAGKSTLLKATAGIVRASGSIAVGAVELTTASPQTRARHIGFMPQMSALGAQLTVLESIVTAAVVGRGVDTATARRSAAEMLDRLDLSGIAFRPLASLSGGQRQLASFAQALVRDPDVLLLDEPTSALDMRYQLRVMSMARDVARAGRVVVAVLHDLALAAQFADRVVVVSAGQAPFDGTPAEVFTGDMLRQVYGIVARVEHGADGRLRIFAESEWAAPSEPAQTANPSGSSAPLRVETGV